MFRSRRNLRRWVAYVLLAWLFGVAAGVANACLIPSPVERDGKRSESALLVGELHQKASAHGDEHRQGLPQTHQNLAHDHKGSPGKANCEDFCDKTASSIPRLKAAIDDAHWDAPPPPTVGIALPVPAFAELQLVLPRLDGGLSPPILIAFLRLAL